MEHKRYWLFVFLFALVISLVFGLAPYILYHLDLINTEEQKVIKSISPIGGIFGPASAFFSGFALIAVIVSIQQQREALKIQAEELELTRNELSESAKAQQEMATHQKNAISLEVIMPFMAEISSPDMRKTIITLSKFSRKESFDVIYADLLAKSRADSLSEAEKTEFETIDSSRRQFVGIFHKMQRLSATGVVDDEIVKVVLGPDHCWLLLNVVEPLDAKIRSNYSRVTFNFIRSLYSEKILDEEGAYN